MTGITRRIAPINGFFCLCFVTFPERGALIRETIQFLMTSIRRIPSSFTQVSKEYHNEDGMEGSCHLIKCSSFHTEMVHAEGIQSSQALNLLVHKDGGRHLSQEGEQLGYKMLGRYALLVARLKKG